MEVGVEEEEVEVAKEKKILRQSSSILSLIHMMNPLSKSLGSGQTGGLSGIFGCLTMLNSQIQLWHSLWTTSPAHIILMHAGACLMHQGNIELGPVTGQATDFSPGSRLLKEMESSMAFSLFIGLMATLRPTMKSILKSSGKILQRCNWTSSLLGIAYIKQIICPCPSLISLNMESVMLLNNSTIMRLNGQPLRFVGT